ncbi:MAG: CDP-alcohol phosphatidyltransferase family protein [Caldisericia bacterium]|nr:CDP-alcohol phosphatidyltransferase family protein [Caldisericia bacterium]
MLPDIFTFLRILSGLFIIYLGVFDIFNFHLYFYSILFGWTTDILDGFLARIFNIEGKLGKFDFQIDLFFEWSFFFYLFKANYINEKIFIIYNIIFVFILIFYYNKTFLMTLQAPVTFSPFIIAIIYYEDLRVIILIWILINLILFHKRFFKVIKEYIEGIPNHEVKNSETLFKNKHKK